MESEIELTYTPAQQEIFFGDNDYKYKIVTKGRRFGATEGAEKAFIEYCLDGITPLLWVDTINGNIDRYYERYFLPDLKKLPSFIKWDWNAQKRVLKINDSLIDFRSSDNPQCYDGQTEVLTNDGWKLFSELNKTEKVFTLNPETIKGEWHLPTNYIQSEYDGQMQHLLSGKVDLLVTPNHNFFILSEDKKRKFKKIGECHSHDKIPASIGFDGIDNDFYTEDKCSIIGYYLADGCSGKNKGGYRVTFSKKDEIKGGSKGNIRQKITEILVRSGCNVIKDGNRFHVINKSLYGVLSPMGNVYTKRIPNEIKNLPVNKLKKIIEWFINGDGTLRVRKTGYEEREFFSCNKLLMDDLQEIVVKCGWSGTIKKQKDVQRPTFIRGREVKMTDSFYRMIICTNKFNYFENGQRRFVSPEQYTGKVYCLTVKNHCILVRRNGKICWSGNSIEGFGYKVIFLNEAGIILKDEYLYAHAILPMLLDYPDSRLIAAGVPKGKTKKDGNKHKFFELYENAVAGNKGYVLHEYSSFDNPILEPSEIHLMINEMTELEAQQEIYGKFVEYGGENPFAHQYRPEKHESTDAVHDPKKQLIISLDFNLNPFAVTFSHIWRDNGGEHDHQFKEISISNGSIPAMVDAITDLYKPYLSGAILTGDSMGKRRELGERDNASLYVQLLRGLGMSERQLKVAHDPTHENSRADCNYFLHNFPDYKINPIECPQTCRDMKVVQCDAFGHIIKRDRKQLNQRADFLDAGLRYKVHNLWRGWIDQHQRNRGYKKN